MANSKVFFSLILLVLSHSAHAHTVLAPRPCIVTSGQNRGLSLADDSLVQTPKGISRRVGSDLDLAELIERAKQPAYAPYEPALEVNEGLRVFALPTEVSLSAPAPIPIDSKHRDGERRPNDP